MLTRIELLADALNQQDQDTARKIVDQYMKEPKKEVLQIYREVTGKTYIPHRIPSNHHSAKYSI